MIFVRFHRVHRGAEPDGDGRSFGTRPAAAFAGRGHGAVDARRRFRRRRRRRFRRLFRRQRAPRLHFGRAVRSRRCVTIFFGGGGGRGKSSSPRRTNRIASVSTLAAGDGAETSSSEPTTSTSTATATPAGESAAASAAKLRRPWTAHLEENKANWKELSIAGERPFLFVCFFF